MKSILLLVALWGICTVVAGIWVVATLVSASKPHYYEGPEEDD